jgi:hypothetical protein
VLAARQRMIARLVKHKAIRYAAQSVSVGARRKDRLDRNREEATGWRRRRTVDARWRHAEIKDASIGIIKPARIQFPAPIVFAMSVTTFRRAADFVAASNVGAAFRVVPAAGDVAEERVEVADVRHAAREAAGAAGDARDGCHDQETARDVCAALAEARRREVADHHGALNRPADGRNFCRTAKVRLNCAIRAGNAMARASGRRRWCRVAGVWPLATARLAAARKRRA